MRLISLPQSTANYIYTKAIELKNSNLYKYISTKAMQLTNLGLYNYLSTKVIELKNSAPSTYLYTKVIQLKNSVGYLTGGKIIQEEPSTTLIHNESVGEVKKSEAYNNSMSKDNLISKVMNVWNKYTGLTYLSQKLEKLSETHNIGLYKYTSQLLFKNNDNAVKKVIQVFSSLFGITHISLIITLLINKLFAGAKQEPQVGVSH